MVITMPMMSSRGTGVVISGLVTHTFGHGNGLSSSRAIENNRGGAVSQRPSVRALFAEKGSPHRA